MKSASVVNPMLTLSYMQTEKENKYFDRKSAQIRAVELAPIISAFANADGGTIVIGISDKRKILEGIKSAGADKINEFIAAPRDYCKPMPKYQEEFLDITNEKGDEDQLLLIHIFSSIDHIIRTSNDKTYLRIGDKTKEVLGDNLRNLEYAKGARHFEDEIHENASMDDLDEDLLVKYKERIGASDLDTHQVMTARGFIRKKDGIEYLTNAAVLLFAKNALKFNMNCRIRFIRVDGREMQVGADYNVVKDKSIDEPILRLIDAAKSYIADQLRVFTRQEHGSGKFVESPEYPEFPWVEGIINAVAHRDWAASGQFIKVAMFDDRLEIESPGRFPDIVTADNISYTRFSRNKTISRVMTEFEWVRELNEGVKKIYLDMADAGLPAPEYVETANTVRLILRNNIDVRTAHRNKALDYPSDGGLNGPTSGAINGAINGAIKLSGNERAILNEIIKKPDITRPELIEKLGIGKGTVDRAMKALKDKNCIRRVGSNKTGHWEVNI